MSGQPYTPEAVQLFLHGQLALSRASMNGLPVDVAYCQAEQARLRAEMDALEAEAWGTPGGEIWRGQYGAAATLGNANQVRRVLFDCLALPKPKPDREAGEEDSEAGTADRDALNRLDHPLARLVLDYRQREKAANTFLASILTETVDGLIHPWFHLHRASSYRSSSSAPNAQNFPIRDPVYGPLVRRAFRAGKGYCFIEHDFKGLEVAIAACYHRDPTMLKYLEQEYDFHRDVTLECYRLTPDQLDAALPKPKAVRFAGKSAFTFPAFYGSYWAQIAPSLWRYATDGDFRLADGTPFTEHLRRKGITGLGEVRRGPDGRILDPARGTYLAFIRDVERRFWGERFRVYAAWKKSWYEAYCRRGYFDSLTGFHYAGRFRRNQVINLPVQGSAFHCLLWTFIETTKALARARMGTRLVAQVHDSMLARVPVGEVADYLGLVRGIASERLPREWRWIVAPLKMDVEGTGEDGTWADKKEIETGRYA